MSKLPSDDVVKEHIMKLLAKAGTDPRVTPRLLREKAEQRMKLDKDTLKAKRESIKDWVLLWWTERNARFAEELKLLVKLSKAAGYAPGIFSDIRDMEDREKQKEILSQRCVFLCIQAYLC